NPPEQEMAQSRSEVYGGSSWQTVRTEVPPSLVETFVLIPLISSLCVGQSDSDAELATLARPLTEADRLLLLVSASFYKPYLPATSFNAGVVPRLAHSLRAAM